jgi:hypothetical protein
VRYWKSLALAALVLPNTVALQAQVRVGEDIRIRLAATGLPWQTSTVVFLSADSVVLRLRDAPINVRAAVGSVALQRRDPGKRWKRAVLGSLAISAVMMGAVADDPPTLAAMGMVIPSVVMLWGVGSFLAPAPWSADPEWTPRCGGWRLAAGSVVRVRADHQSIAGTVTAHEADSLRVREEHSGDVVVLPTDGTSLALRSRSRLRGALTGAAIGGGLGLLMRGEDTITGERAHLLEPGLFIGALVGAATTKSGERVVAIDCQ